MTLGWWMSRSETLLLSIALPASVLQQVFTAISRGRLHQNVILYVISNIISVPAMAKTPSLKTNTEQS